MPNELASIASGMGVMPGTMGLGFVGFIDTCTLMMAAMSSHATMGGM